MQRVCPTSAALFRCGCGDSKNKQSLRQKTPQKNDDKDQGGTNMNTKKLMTLLLAVVLVLSLAACGA